MSGNSGENRQNPHNFERPLSWSDGAVPRESNRREPRAITKTYKNEPSRSGVQNPVWRDSSLSPHSSEFFPRMPYRDNAQDKENVLMHPLCNFCKSNGESSQMYTSHRLKIISDNRSIVMCPVLRGHVCMHCKATGDDAHTETYCPMVIAANNGRRPVSTAVILKMMSGKKQQRK